MLSVSWHSVTFFLLAVPASLIAGMLSFVLLRRWVRALHFARVDRYRRIWLELLPEMLEAGSVERAGATARALGANRLVHDREARSTLETLLVDRLEAELERAPERARNNDLIRRLTGLLERTGFFDRHLLQLRKGRPWQQLESANLLGRAQAGLAVAPLVGLLSHPLEEVRNGAARALGTIGRAGELRGASEILRRAAAEVVPGAWLEMVAGCRIPPATLLPLLEDDRPEVRAVSARALAVLPDAPTLAEIEPFAFHPDHEVRAAVARALERVRDPGATALLVALVNDPAWFVRLRAVAALKSSEPAEALGAVLRATRDPHFRVRARAVATLQHVTARPANVVRELVQAADRYALQAYLSLLGRSGVLWRAVGQLGSRERREREEARALLGVALQAGAREELVYALEGHPDLRVRAAAARLLAVEPEPHLAADLAGLEKRLPAGRERCIVRWLQQRIATPQPAEAAAEAPQHVVAGRV